MVKTKRKSYYWKIMAIPKHGGQNKTLETNLTLTEANENLKRKRKERGRLFQRGGFTFKKVRGKLRKKRKK